MPSQRTLLDHLRMMNEDHLSTRYDNTNLAARVASYELAYKMQSSAPEAVDIEKEPEHIKELYGVDGSRTDDFGVNVCLPAEWSSVECALFRCIQVVITTMPTGMPMEILSKTTSSMREILINRLPDC